MPLYVFSNVDILNDNENMLFFLSVIRFTFHSQNQGDGKDTGIMDCISFASSQVGWRGAVRSRWRAFSLWSWWIFLWLQDWPRWRRSLVGVRQVFVQRSTGALLEEGEESCMLRVNPRGFFSILF